MSNENTAQVEQPLVEKPMKKRRSGFKRFMRRLAMLALLVIAICVYWFYFNPYSDGERTGVLIKVTRKGNVFKTNEGEMWLSCRQMTNPEKFYFSVVNDSINAVMKNLQDECVQLEYKQYRAPLVWRGDSKYIISGIRPIKQN